MQSSSRWAAGLALGVVVVLAAACSSGGAASSTTTSSTTSSTGGSEPVVVHTARVGSLGTALVSAKGLTVYHLTSDGTGKSVCNGACATTWPPLTVPAGTTHVAGGPGVTTSDLGLIVRTDGSHQVTFKGMPLYTYSGDTRGGEATGQGIDGTWFVVTPGTATAPTSSTSTTKASGGYGY